MITVIVIDDHPIFAQGVVNALNLESDIAVLDKKSSGEEGFEAIKELKPQVAIVDVNLPGLNGQQITGRVVKEKLPTKIILLTAYDDIEQRVHAIRAGASGYCTKDVKPEKLADIIRSVVDGNYILGEKEFSFETIKNWLEDQSVENTSYYSTKEANQPLSPREMEVLLEMSKGYSNKEIALELSISRQTVKNHVTSIFRKLQVDDRTQAVLYAVRHGWVRLYDQDKN